MPQRAFKPTEENRREVKMMAGFGIPQAEIAAAVGCHQETLRKHFRDELDLGMTEANVKVAQTLFAMATSGTCVAATIFWLKTRAGWKEPERGGGGEETTVIRVLGGLAGPDAVQEMRVPRALQ